MHGTKGKKKAASHKPGAMTCERFIYLFNKVY